MNARYTLSALLSVGAVVLPAATTAQTDLQLTESRALVDAFASELQRALVEALGNDGPVGAVEVCKDVAPAIASRLSRENGAKVGRTTLRPRNPINAPEPWQTDALLEFERRSAAATDSAAPLEHFKRLARGYAQGDLRGAFSVMWPAADEPARR